MKYDNQKCNQFVEDMIDSYYEVEHYHGRNFWHGPAVRLDDASEYQDVIRSTEVRVQYDQMGRSGIIVYPVARGNLIEE